VSQVTYDSRQRDSRHISSDRDTILNSYLLVAIKADLNYAFYLVPCKAVDRGRQS